MPIPTPQQAPGCEACGTPIKRRETWFPRFTQFKCPDCGDAYIEHHTERRSRR